MKQHWEQDCSIAQEQADQVRRTTGATLAARALEEVLPALGRGYSPQETRKAAARMSKDMDKPGFTPGPWRATSTYGEDAKEPWMVWSDAKSAAIAHIYARSEMGADSSREQAANARLIASAPDLYAALGAIESYLTSHLVIGKNGKASTEVANMLDTARAALARAKGGEA